MMAPSLANCHRAQTLIADSLKPNAKYEANYEEVKSMVSKMGQSANNGEREAPSALTSICTKLLAWEGNMPKGSCTRVRELLWAQLVGNYQSIFGGHNEDSNPEDAKEIPADRMATIVDMK
eukprot:440332-Pyramimonas_sp.AAC.1